MSAFPSDTEREARFKVESAHHFHGNECLCGFVSPVSRQRTEHITEVLLEALAPHIAAREAQAATKERDRLRATIARVEPALSLLHHRGLVDSENNRRDVEEALSEVRDALAGTIEDE